jgi:uncharacterized protein
VRGNACGSASDESASRVIVVGYLATVLMGMTLGVLGGGGSILTVPIFVYLLSVAPERATFYSLFIVGSTALVGAILAWRRGSVNLKTAALFAVPSVVSVYLTRQLLVPALPDPLLALRSIRISKALAIMLLFATLMLLAARAMLRKPRAIVAPPQNPGSLNRENLKLVAQGALVGCVTGLVGAGGGFLIVPALITLVGLPMSNAVGTSLLIIAANSISGFAGGVLHAHAPVPWKLLLTLLGLALVGLVIGQRVAKNLPEQTLKRGFAALMLCMGSVILIDQLRQMLAAG